MAISLAVRIRALFIRILERNFTGNYVPSFGDEDLLKGLTIRDRRLVVAGVDGKFLLNRVRACGTVLILRLEIDREREAAAFLIAFQRRFVRQCERIGAIRLQFQFADFLSIERNGDRTFIITNRA